MTFATKTQPVIGAWRVKYDGGYVDCPSEGLADQIVTALEYAHDTGAEKFAQDFRKFVGIKND